MRLNAPFSNLTVATPILSDERTAMQTSSAPRRSRAVSTAPVTPKPTAFLVSPPLRSTSSQERRWAADAIESASDTDFFGLRPMKS